MLCPGEWNVAFRVSQTFWFQRQKWRFYFANMALKQQNIGMYAGSLWLSTVVYCSRFSPSGFIWTSAIDGRPSMTKLSYRMGWISRLKDPLVMSIIAIENGHRNSRFTHWKMVMFHINHHFPMVFHGFPIVLCKRLPGRVGPAPKTVRFTEISKAVSENDGSFKWTNDNFFSPKSLGLFDLFLRWWVEGTIGNHPKDLNGLDIILPSW